ncbi:hypothetical protein [Ostreiculturibacter nitratireducens]|uniref:hypothetical protein n=1 Tax=Ostreiculturibacter nitratireducens TaxID=3075226 RepID=UPI0031B601CC
MSTLKEEIVGLLNQRPGLTDREITNALRGLSANQQPVNSACRELEASKVLARARRRPSDNLIGNYLTGHALGDGGPTTKQPSQAQTGARKVTSEGDLSEDEIKKLLAVWLANAGWEAHIAWGKTAGIDIDARRDGERWIIEAKGPGSRPPMRVNYFLAVLGETLQRMNDEAAAYSIAFPDMKQFRGLWDRLPTLAKQRTGISALFISSDGTVDHVTDR